MAEATTVNLMPENLDDYVKNPEKYEHFLKAVTLWRNVPSVNYIPLENLKCEQLVRFRGMIQDMSNLEMYVDLGQMVKKSAPDSPDGKLQSFKYRESLIMKDDEYFDHGCAENRWCDRRPLTLVSVPGLNAWVSEHESAANNVMETDETDENGIPKKKPLINDWTSPIKDRPSKVCVVKLYKDFDKYSLCSVVDVLGYLFKFNNYERHSIIHAIAVEKLQHYNPLMDLQLSLPNQLATQVQSIHGELHKFLSICMLNDDLAAKYLLCYLISSIFSRNNEILGKFCLNLYNMPKTQFAQMYTKELYNLLELLLPASHFFPLSVAALNTSQFHPAKNYEENVIMSGMLQLAPHTYLVVDETVMQPGTLESTGLFNLIALSDLILYQNFVCEFQYYQIKYDVDVPVLVLSEGPTLLKTDFSIPLEADENCLPFIKETFAAARHYLQSEGRLEKFRKFLTYSQLATTECKLLPETGTKIANDYVELRQQNIVENHFELNNMIVFARYLGICRGQLAMDVETWDLAKQLEAERKKRVDRMPREANNMLNFIN